MKQNRLFNAEGVKLNFPVYTVLLGSLLILSFPIVLLWMYLIQERFFGMSLQSIVLVSMFPCGVIGLLLTIKGHNKAKSQNSGLNKFIGSFLWVIGWLITLGGILGLMLIFIVTQA